MGSGVALAILQKYPVVLDKYKEMFKDVSVYDTHELLGKNQFVSVSYGLTVVNMFTQEKTGSSDQVVGQVAISYDAIYNCFSRLNVMIPGEVLSIPMIGAGLGGGNWKIIEQIINETTPDVDVHVYVL